MLITSFKKLWFCEFDHNCLTSIKKMGCMKCNMNSSQSSRIRAALHRVLFRYNLRCHLYNSHKAASRWWKFYRCSQNYTSDDCNYFNYLDEIDHLTPKILHHLHTQNEIIHSNFVFLLKYLKIFGELFVIVFFMLCKVIFFRV